jgi:hypothetical protein
MEQEAMARMGELGVSGTPAELDTAGQMAYNAGMAGQNNQYQAGIPWNSNYIAGGMQLNYDPGSMTDANTMNQYMDPYYQNVVDIQKREASRQADIRDANIGLEAAGQGSLGGYREAIMQAENERNLRQQMGDIQAQGTQAAWQSGVQNFEADRQARAGQEQLYQNMYGLMEGQRLAQAQQGTQAYSAYEAARQAQAQLGQQGTQSQLAAAGMLGDFTQQRQDMELQRLNQMLQAGGMERQLMQGAYDTGYQDFLRQQAYPREQVAMYQNLMYGLPVTPGGYSNTYGQGPSSTQQLLSGGLGGLALYGLTQGGKGGTG